MQIPFLQALAIIICREITKIKFSMERLLKKDMGNTNFFLFGGNSERGCMN